MSISNKKFLLLMFFFMGDGGLLVFWVAVYSFVSALVPCGFLLFSCLQVACTLLLGRAGEYIIKGGVKLC